MMASEKHRERARALAKKLNLQDCESFEGDIVIIAAAFAEVEREALERAALFCDAQGKDLMDTAEKTEGSKASTQILKQQAASAYGCGWAIRALAATPKQEGSSHEG
jgi:hypothetical protein